MGLSTSPFDHLVNYLTKTSEAVKVEPIQYETFQREYLFDKIKGKSFGSAFCEKFHVNDIVLSILSTDKDAMSHIKFMGYVQ